MNVSPDQDRAIEELVDALARGDAGARAQVFAQHVAAVRGMLRRALGPSADVEDLLQETFVLLFRRAKSIRDARSLRAFVMTIATNLMRDELRARQRRRSTFDASAEHASRATAREEGPRVDARDALRRFYRVLDRLEADDRAAFVLRYIEDEDFADVAAYLGVSASTLKRRLAPILEKVTAMVNEDADLAEFLSPHTRWVVDAR